MNQGFLHAPSNLYNVDSDGDVVVVLGSRCTTV
jgi:hypothetical protein